jgi:hypothetical protein
MAHPGLGPVGGHHNQIPQIAHGLDQSPNARGMDTVIVANQNEGLAHDRELLVGLDERLFEDEGRKPLQAAKPTTANKARLKAKLIFSPTM